MSRARTARPWLALLAAAAGAAAVLSGCAGARSTAPVSQVVAAENFWGSIAEQLAGSRLAVTSIIVNPDTDPHAYQATAGDARTMAGAKLAIVNGIGYDTWASKLLAANPVSGRAVLDVGDLLGLKEGDNPHQWYSPASVRRVIDAIVADYTRIDPADRAYFAARKRPLRDRLARDVRPAAGDDPASASPASRSATARASSSRSAGISA